MSKEKIGRLLLEASTGMHGEEAKILSDAWCDMARKNEELQSRIAELEKDAERYRWLRDSARDEFSEGIAVDIWDSDATGRQLKSEELDAAIDTAMQKD